MPSASMLLHNTNNLLTMRDKKSTGTAVWQWVFCILKGEMRKKKVIVSEHHCLQAPHQPSHRPSWLKICTIQPAEASPYFTDNNESLLAAVVFYDPY